MTTSRSNAPEVWELPLVTLREVLTREAMEDRGKWAMRLLPRGALVALRLEETGKEPPEHIRFVLRIARRTRADTSFERAKWEQELAVFERFLQLKDPPWERVEESSAQGTAVRYLERTS